MRASERWLRSRASRLCASPEPTVPPMPHPWALHLCTASSASAQDATAAPKVERPAPSASAAAAAVPHRRSSDERADRRSSGDATLSEPTGSMPQPSADGAHGHGKGKPASAKGKLPSADGSKPSTNEVKQPKHRALPPGVYLTLCRVSARYSYSAQWPCPVPPRVPLSTAVFCALL